MQQDMQSLEALSKLRSASMISQGSGSGKSTPADHPKLGGWVAGMLTRPCEISEKLKVCVGSHNAKYTKHNILNIHNVLQCPT